jgi:hypothetical protein
LKIDYSGRNLILLKKEKKNAYGECRKNFKDTVRFLVEHYPNVGFTKCKVKRVVNLFEDTGSVLSRAKKTGRQNHALTQWKMLHCKTVLNINYIKTYHHVV